MHYMNGREAKAGDIAVHFDQYSNPSSGVLHSIKGDTQTCNGMLAPMVNTVYVTIGDCLHADDYRAAFAEKVKPVLAAVAEKK